MCILKTTLFKLMKNIRFRLKTDAIINWAASTEGLLTLKLEDLPNDGQQWLSGPEGSQLLVMALRTAPRTSDQRSHCLS